MGIKDACLLIPLCDVRAAESDVVLKGHEVRLGTGTFHLFPPSKLVESSLSFITV